ncbi:hypothetical protein BGZ96_003153 [Linnemannia gamsii]|uniref:F-box domain-containing protein n=1 Tax=Linnemannia gamsii TaxID=64522 RepID=A0ABQ7K9U4_9FUNG|nr:hypothetical protein BGZ96_003153 [Linnemannia gamsii]
MELSACDRFFKVPELVLLLMTHLKPREISRFMLTNHSFYSICIPSLYRTLTIIHIPGEKTLFYSAAATLMLAKNTRHVQRLECGMLELVYLANAHMAFDDIESQISGAIPPYQPSWLPARDTPVTCQLVPMPIMNRVTTLVLEPDSYAFMSHLRQCPYYLPSCVKKEEMAFRICWILRRMISSSSSFSHLRDLTIVFLYVPSPKAAVVLSATIKLLTGLTRLELGLYCLSWVGRTSVQRMMLHCCPSLLEMLNIYVRLFEPEELMDQLELITDEINEDPNVASENDDDGENESDDGGNGGGSEHDMDVVIENDGGDEGNAGEVLDDNDDEDEEIQEFDVGHGAEPSDLLAICGTECLIKRTTPLISLKVLWLWDLLDYTKEEVTAICMNCPNIVQFHLPNILGVYNVDDIARTVATLCPKVRTLQFYGEGQGTNIDFPFKVLEAMPEQQLERVCIRNFHIELDEQMTRSVFLRHSATLHTLILQGCSPTDSAAVRTILTECVVLEDLRFVATHQADFEAIWPYPDLYGKGCGILLADAIAAPWACTKIKHLNLLVRINELCTGHELAPPAYFRRETPVELLPAEVHYFEPLEQLYRQIGRLVELQHLDLRLDMMGPNGEMHEDTPACTEVSFPGLMNIGMGRPGYLELLGGLSKLRQLRGSVLADTYETKLRVGAMEVFWMRDHWPELEWGDFFCAESKFLLSTHFPSNTATMSSPQERLFRLPELLHQILLRLSNESICSLMVTNKLMRDRCARYLYHTLDLDFAYGGFNILASTQAKLAISKNAHYVQKLTIGHVDLCYLYNCLRAAVDENVEASPSADNLAVSLTSFLPPLDIWPIEFIPISHMINLTDLTFSLAHVCTHSRSPYRVLSLRNSSMIVAQACYVISLSPHLVNLTILDLVIKKHREVRLLGETIFGLSCLRSLNVKLRVKGSWHSAGSWYKAGSTIVFNCPKLIQKLWIELVDYGSVDSNMNEGSDGDSDDDSIVEQYRMQLHYRNLNYAYGDMDQDMSRDDDEDMDGDIDVEMIGYEYDGDTEEEMDYDEQDEKEEVEQPSEESWSLQHWESQQRNEDELMSRPGRCEPLMELVDVKLWNFVNGVTDDEVVWLYEHCCKAEKLAISSFEHDIDPKTVANIIRTLCTKIRKLTFTAPESGSWSETLPFEVLSAIPKQQLMGIDYRGVTYKMNKEMAQRSILRHSATLTTVVFKDCQQIASDAIQAVLVECACLFDFQVNWHEDEVVSFLHLADAIAIPWASKNFTRLGLTIGVPRVQLERHQQLYYWRSPKCVLSFQEKHQFVQLECLYRQLASLKDLVYLDLRALYTRTSDGTIENPFYYEYTFPGMMSLADPKSGRPGFLELFAGWNKLEVLRGSFSVNTRETLETMGCLESSWLSQHWPAWKEAEFFQGFDESREVFLWLEGQRQKDNPSFSLGLQ